MREEKAGKGVLMEKASRLPLPLSLSLSLSLIPYSSRKSPYIAIILCSFVTTMLSFRTWLFGRIKVFL